MQRVPTVEFDGRTLKSISRRPIALNALGEGEEMTAVHTRAKLGAATMSAAPQLQSA